MRELEPAAMLLRGDLTPAERAYWEAVAVQQDIEERIAAWQHFGAQPAPPHLADAWDRAHETVLQAQVRCEREEV